LQSFGKAYSPAALLVLASSLAASPPEASEGDGSDGGEEGYLRHRVPQVAAVAAARFVMIPLCSFALLQGALRMRWLAPDPLRDFMILLQTCMPPAQNTVLALQVGGMTQRATQMARVLLCLYLMSAVPIAGVLTVLLQTYAGAGGFG